MRNAINPRKAPDRVCSTTDTINLFVSVDRSQLKIKHKSWRPQVSSIYTLHPYHLL